MSSSIVNYTTVKVPQNNTVKSNGVISSVVNQERIQAFVVTSNNKIRILTSSNTHKFAKKMGDPAQLAPWGNVDFEGTQYNEQGVAEDTSDADPQNLSPVHFLTAMSVTSLVVGTMTYFFWIEKDTSVLCAGRMNPAVSQTKVEWAEINISSANNPASNFIIGSNGVAACIGGDVNEILVVYPTISSLNQLLQLNLLVLNTERMNPRYNTWEVDTTFSPTYCTAQPPISPSSKAPGDLENTSMSGFIVRLPNTTDPTGTSTRFFYSLYSSSTRYANTGYFPLDGNCRSTPGTVATTTSILWPGTTGPGQVQFYGFTIKGDPAGRPVAFYSDNNHVNSMATIDTTQTGTLAWEGPTPLTNQNNEQQKSNTPFNGVFVPGLPARSTTAGITTTTVNVFLAQFYVGTDSYVRFCEKAQGSLTITSTIQQVSTAHQGQAVPTLIGDPFPMPMPAPYLWLGDSPDGMADWSLFDYEYLVTEESTSSLVVEFSAALGMKLTTQVGFLVKTRNAAELMLGGGYNLNKTNSKFEAKSFKLITKGQPNPYHAQDAAPYIIRPYGGYSARVYPSLRTDSYVYSEYVGTTLTQISGVKAQALAAYLPIINEAGSELRNGDFFVYTGNPGDMTSFTRESIDNRMNQLYQKLTALPNFNTDVTTDFSSNRSKPNGDLFKYYTGSSYLDQVIADFAVPLNRNGDKSLSFSMSGTSFSDSQFKSTSSVTNAGRFFMNFSYYNGVSIGDDNITGDIGVEIALNIVKSLTEASNWGLGCRSYLDTFAPGQALTVELYLLGASPLWAAELKYFPSLARPMYLAALPGIALAGSAPQIANPPGLNHVLNPDVLALDSALPQRLLFVVSSWDGGNSENNPALAPPQ